MSEAILAEESPVIENTGSGGQKKLDTGFKRNLKIIVGAFAAVIAIVVLMFLFTDNLKKRPDGASSIDRGSSITGGEGDLGPNMTKKVQNVQIREAEESAKRNESYIPKDIVSAVDQNSTPFKDGPPQPQFQQQQFPGQNNGPGASPYANYVPQASQAELDREARRREGANRQLEALVQTQRPPANMQRIAGSAPAAAAAAGAGDPGAQSALSAQNAPPQALLTDALEIYGAETTSPVNTDGTNYVSARITSGKLAGAFLIGSSKLAGENVETTFSQMRFAGKTYPVQAIALDQNTATNALEGKVDRKLLQRYAMPVSLAVVQAFAQAKSQTAQTSNAVQGVGVVQNIPAPTTEQARNAGIARGLEILSNRVAAAANEPIAVSLAPFSAIGIMFTAPVALR